MSKPDPDDALVEKVARALYECERQRSIKYDQMLGLSRSTMEPWDECRDTYMSDARAAIAEMMLASTASPLGKDQSSEEARRAIDSAKAEILRLAQVHPEVDLSGVLLMLASTDQGQSEAIREVAPPRAHAECIWHFCPYECPKAGQPCQHPQTARPMKMLIDNEGLLRKIEADPDLPCEAGTPDQSSDQASRSVVPPGYALVPINPTEEMIVAGWIDKEDVNPDDIYRAMIAAAPQASREGAMPDEALTYAASLASALWDKHWKDDAPNWKPLPDLIGVLTQIDNMTCGLSRYCIRDRSAEQSEAATRKE